MVHVQEDPTGIVSLCDTCTRKINNKEEMKS